MPGKFKPGDRVVYHCDGWIGNPDLDGHAGTVIGVDKTNLPYTVEFDDEFLNSMEDMRFGGKKGHCWCCAEERLQSEDNGGDDDVPSDIEKNEKEKEINMANIMWTTEMDKKLLDMKDAGMNYDAMASEMNLDAKKVQQRLYYLRKVKGKFALADKTEPETGAAEKAEDTTQPEEQKGELNDLEKTMAETITEQASEIDNLKGTVKDLEGSLCEAHEENTGLHDQICSLTEKVATLESELQDTKKDGLAKVDEIVSLNEKIRSLAEELADIKTALAKAETDLDEERDANMNDVALLSDEIKKLNDRMKLSEKTFGEILCKKDEQIALLEANCERYLNLIIGLTEERLSSHAS